MEITIRNLSGLFHFLAFLALVSSNMLTYSLVQFGNAPNYLPDTKLHFLTNNHCTSNEQLTDSLGTCKESECNLDRSGVCNGDIPMSC